MRIKVDSVLVEVSVKDTKDLIDGIKMLSADMGYRTKISIGGQYEIEYP